MPCVCGAITAVFQLQLTAVESLAEAARSGLTAPTKSRSAVFNLVDLAGSERQKQTQSSGERLKEAQTINKSLSTLGQVSFTSCGLAS